MVGSCEKSRVGAVNALKSSITGEVKQVQFKCKEIVRPFAEYRNQSLLHL